MNPHSSLLRTAALVTSGLLASTSLLPAQTLKAVFGADVNPDHQSLQYRAAYTDDLGNGEEGFAHRIHYQQSFGERLMLRPILAQSKVGSGDLEFRSFRLETWYQILENEDAGWDSLLRFDVQVPDGGDGPGFTRLAWSNVWDLDPCWQVRANLLLGRQVFNDPSNDLFGEGRAQVAYKFGNDTRLGVDYYANAGFLENTGGFERQDHLVGPFLAGPLGGGVSYHAQTLFGVTDAATDTQFRLFLGYSF